MSEPKFRPGDRVTSRTRGYGPLTILSNYDPTPCYWKCATSEGATLLIHEGDLSPAPTEAEAKFRVGDRVKVGGRAGIVKELDPDVDGVKVRFGPDLMWWVRRDNVTPDPPTPRFEPGQRVRINGMSNSAWNGKEARIVGPEADGWWRVELDVDGTPEVNGFHHSKLEPVAERHHDGQANTSGIDLTDLDAVKKIAESTALVDALREWATPPSPSLLTVLEGVHDWQQVDPARRRAHVSLSGHTATVHVTTLPDLAARRVKFCSPCPAEDVRHILDDIALVAAAHPDLEFKMARNDVRFAEDTGEAD